MTNQTPDTDNDSDLEQGKIKTCNDASYDVTKDCYDYDTRIDLVPKKVEILSLDDGPNFGHLFEDHPKNPESSSIATAADCNELYSLKTSYSARILEGSRKVGKFSEAFNETGSGLNKAWNLVS